MKKEEFCKILGDVRDKYVDEAAKSGYHKLPNLTKWAALAACLAAVLLTVTLLTPRKAGDAALASTLADLGVPAEEIRDPILCRDAEMPKMSKDDLLASVRSNTTVSGRVTRVESVRIPDGDTVTYITVALIDVEEVLTGGWDGGTLRLISAASYTGVPDAFEAPMVPAPHLGAVHEGFSGVFVLREFDPGGVWTICGREINPAVLADSLVRLVLDRDGDTLTYPEQNISISISEIAQ